MTIDSYKGESLQKKIVRIQTHLAVKRYLDGKAPGLFADGIHVFLASREGGDIGVLKWLGVSPRTMLGVDRNEEAIKNCAEKWATILCAPAGSPWGPGLIHAADIADVVREVTTALGGTSGGPRIAHAFLDFCCHIDKSTIDSMTSVWRSLPRGSVLTVAILKGREKIQANHRVVVAPVCDRKRRRGEAKVLGRRGAVGAATVLLAKMIRGEVQWDARTVELTIQSMPGLAPSNRGIDVSRMGLINLALTIVESGVVPVCLSAYEYQSTTNASRGVPMLVASFAKLGRGEPIPKMKWTRMTEAFAIDMRSSILRQSSSTDAALLLNVEPSTASAWKAHVTRGTYKAAS